jgi:FKBP-type peptidyl-prolyl cis-trans isomerase FkpA
MKQTIKLVALAIATSAILFACKGGNGGYTKLKPGLEYKIFANGKGENVKDSDFVKMHMIQQIGDSVLMSTYKNPDGPQLNQITKQTGQNLDPTPIFLKMKAGDSVVIRYNADSIFKKNPPPFYKKGQEIKMIVKITEILSKKEADSLKTEMAKQMEAQQKMMEEMQKKQMEETAKLAPLETKKIEAYIASKGLKLTKKSPQGVYICVTQDGTGDNVRQGATVTMNYTGYNLEGKKFDSNVDPSFKHVQPFEFPLGSGQVIPGWDDAIGLLNKGAKATIIIPSYLAYGPQEKGDVIKPNTILAFDIEVVDFK